MLPLPIPVPTFIGRPGQAFPWPYFGARLLPGREPAGSSLDGLWGAVGAALGGFLRALHDPTVLVAHGVGLPRDPMSRADMTVRVPKTRELLAAAERQGLWRAPSAVEAILQDAEALGSAGGEALVHGELHIRHVLIDDAMTPSGVIDWGDMCIGDPSIDLTLSWSLLDEDGRRTFREAYGPIPADRLLRARVRAIFLNATLASYAADTGSESLLAETIAGLGRTLDDHRAH